MLNYSVAELREDILTRLMEGEQDFMSLIPCNYNSNKKVNVKAA